MPKRVVITGIGAVTPIGIGLQTFWNNLIGGKSGAAPITRFDAAHHKTTFACEVKEFDPLQRIDKKTARRMDIFCQFAVASAAEAIENAELKPEELDPERIGVIYGSGIGGMTTYEDQCYKVFQEGPKRVSPFFVPMMIGDIVPGHISMRWNLKGVNYGVQSACATSSHALGIAFMHLQNGDADAIVCGGSEAPICPVGMAGFNAMNAISTRNDAPQKASRPFDLERDGFVMGEGAATLVLETMEHAIRRNAPILAELAGYGFSADAHHLTAPAPGGEGAVRSMRAALKSARIPPTDIDYINAHGTSTPLNDQTETEAIKTTFGDHAYKLAISSTKSMTGHLLGAAGAVELAACVLAIRHGIIPPTINLEKPDPVCDLNYTPNYSARRPVDIALSNTFGFGGHNASLIVCRWNEK